MAPVVRLDEHTTLAMTENDRYAFDVIGELYFGRMFGFMEHSHDHENYIHSLDTLMPILLTSAVAPTYTRPLILTSSIFSGAVRQALKAIEHIANAARGCVGERMQGSTDGEESHRRDILHQLLEITYTKGEKVDFGIREVEYEAYVGL